ncbi:MAG: histidinol phosphate phosphatase domain-containing protein [bacterium]|nr:histidinol phosphate phosphatase domain-containing protein [bacterium]
MIDLHTHSFFSDGVLLPAELIRRARVKGCIAVGITDHVDQSNFDFVIPKIITACTWYSESHGIVAIPGVEITHVPPQNIPSLVREARELGARLVIVHGETLVEPVMPGTNLAALQADIDILAHPGLISEEEVALARDKSIYLEITARSGHSLTNGYVARISQKIGAGLVINTDAHEPSDLIDQDMAWKIGLGAGMIKEEIEIAFDNAKRILDRCLGK